MNNEVQFVHDIGLRAILYLSFMNWFVWLGVAADEGSFRGMGYYLTASLVMFTIAHLFIFRRFKNSDE